MVVERFVFQRRKIVKFFEEIKSENADISNEKYSVLNLYRCKFEDFNVKFLYNV